MYSRQNAIDEEETKEEKKNMEYLYGNEGDRPRELRSLSLAWRG